MSEESRERLTRIFHAAVRAVDPARLVRDSLSADASGVSLRRGEIAAFVPWSGAERVYLVGGGKAGRTMGEAALGALGGKVAGGALAVPKGEGGRAGRVRFIEAGHPLPDEGSNEAAMEMIFLLDAAGERDLVVALISGGGSAMISAPAGEVTPQGKAAVSRLLLEAGAEIASFNTVRKHLSRVKGGLMARAAHPASVFALLLSDVPGDAPSVIASGPFSPDPTRFADALGVLSRSGIAGKVPGDVLRHLEAGARGGILETPKPGDGVFGKVTCAVVGSNRTAMEAAAAAARDDGIATVRLLPEFLRGEARECARAFASELRAMASACRGGMPAVLIAGGETTVSVKGSGRGGRNQEFALAAAEALDGEAGLAVLCAGTDGVDGPTDAAGAVVDGGTAARARERGVSPCDFLANNDAWSFFREIGGLVVTGPTGTNVADVAIGFVRPAP